MTLRRRTWALRGLLDPSTLVFALFLSIGYFKGDPRLTRVPFDLTLLFGALSAMFAMSRLLKRPFGITRALTKPLALLFLFFALSAIPILWTDWTPYASTKVATLFSITLGAALLPLVLLTTEDQVGRFLNALAAISLLVSLDLLTSLAFNGRALTGFLINPIALARAIAPALIWVFLLVMARRFPALPGSLLTALLAALMFIVGARGPLLALALAFFAVLSLRTRRGQSLRLVIAIAVFAAVFIPQLNTAPGARDDRVYGLLRGDVGTTGIKRVEMYGAAWEQVTINPLGMGWGAFAELLAGRNAPQYPHNILLESSLEGGWLLGILLLALLLIALKRGAQGQPTAERNAIYSLFVFFLLNSMLSGDINANRFLWPMLTLTLRPTLMARLSARAKGPRFALGPRPPSAIARLETPTR